MGSTSNTRRRTDVSTIQSACLAPATRDYLGSTFVRAAQKVFKNNVSNRRPTRSIIAEVDELLRVLQRGADAPVVGGSHAGRGLWEGTTLTQGRQCVLGGMAQVSDGRGGKEVPWIELTQGTRHRRTFGRVIPWLDARQQSQPPFHPARRRYRKCAEEARSTRIASQEGWQKCS